MTAKVDDAKPTKTPKLSGGRITRMPYKKLYDTEIEEMISVRRALKVHDDELVDVTPKLLKVVDNIKERKYKILNETLKADLSATDSSTRGSLMSRQSVASHSSAIRFKLGGLRLSLDDVINNVGSLQNVFISNEQEEESMFYLRRSEHKYPFIKVVLQKSPIFLLYEAGSFTVPKGTKLAQNVEMDNTIYDYLTIGRGNVRRRSDAETQTIEAIMKTRYVNTYYRNPEEKGTYVSLYELHDTYKGLPKRDKDETGRKKIQRIQKMYDLEHSAELVQLTENSRFKFATMVMERILAGNVYQKSQLRFRNFCQPSKSDSVAEYRYKPEIIFTLHAPKFGAQQASGLNRKAVSDISFCYGNGDILAVAYGLFSYSALITVSTGNVCIWSIKNPQHPERCYRYNIPVTSVEFSPFLPFLLAVGMMDGTVEVRNITKPNDPPIAVSQRSTSLNGDPVIALRWIKQPQDKHDTDPILALSSNGSVWKYYVIHSPYLLGFKQMVLYRVDGQPEGLQLKQTPKSAELFANRRPLGLNITLHPQLRDIYFMLTDEGCVYKCSTNSTHTYLDIWQTHEGAVNCMDFSPWSPKLFLTCGNDWCIRIWMDGILKPLITLKYKMKPIYAAQWSRSHSTVIIATNRSSLDVWDIHRNILAPISRTKLSKSFNTMFKHSLCGRSLAVGNERGDVFICSLVKMPFQPYFQYDALRRSLFNAISTSADLLIELNNIGFFGYPGKGFKPEE
ncbi:PREDICTED: WD repeat-containing protein 78-like [Bactrocera latifrons]|uniref:WD repeat-containing protein 78-like n=1 Tax=Bactrocera latifrons TaxID=174628 RepID=UPI0008DCBAB1|nr:PREDICTED: WD repeat-containing protein 78-like [Bactrocera latifrons]